MISPRINSENDPLASLPCTPVHRMSQLIYSAVKWINVQMKYWILDLYNSMEKLQITFININI